ncbi:MAG: hypothetical protein HY936_06085 [Nitrosomonadales bacterium]|nr:hypothetical protein [Nitrosomonadales bacterium]
MTGNRRQRTEDRGQRCCRGCAALLIDVPHGGTQTSVFCLLSSVFCLLSSVLCPLSSVFR